MHPIIFGIWGAVTMLLGILAVGYGIQVKGLCAERDQAIKLAEECVDIKKKTEEAYLLRKTQFEEILKHPIVAQFTDEQVATLAKQLGALLGPYSFGSGRLQ